MANGLVVISCGVIYVMCIINILLYSYCFITNDDCVYFESDRKCAIRELLDCIYIAAFFTFIVVYNIIYNVERVY